MKKFSFTFTFFAFIFFCSCKKSTIETSHEPDQNVFYGGVYLFDQGEKAVDQSGMTVSIENSNPVVSAITVKQGVFGGFSLNIDPALQSFALVYAKPQFGTYKRYFTRSASGELYMIEFDGTKSKAQGYLEILGSKSTVTINSFNVAIVDGKLRYTSNISSPDTSEKMIRVIYQKDLPDISINNVDYNKVYWTFFLRVKNGDNVTDHCLACSMECADWKKGDTIYFNAYGDAYHPSAYTDVSSKKYILPNMNLNNKLTPVSIVIP